MTACVPRSSRRSLAPDPVIDPRRPWEATAQAAVAFLLDIDGSLLDRDDLAPRDPIRSPSQPDGPLVAFAVRSPGVSGLLSALFALGPTAIFCDRDRQALIAYGRLADATDQMILVVPWDPTRIDTVIRLLPARHYVAIDDDPAALALIKDALRARVTTIHVAHSADTECPALDGTEPADRFVDSLADVLDLELDRLRAYLS